MRSPQCGCNVVRLREVIAHGTLLQLCELLAQLNVRMNVGFRLVTRDGEPPWDDVTRRPTNGGFRETLTAVWATDLGRKEAVRFCGSYAPKRTGCLRPASVALAGASEWLGWVDFGRAVYDRKSPDSCLSSKPLCVEFG